MSKKKLRVYCDLNIYLLLSGAYCAHWITIEWSKLTKNLLSVEIGNTCQLACFGREKNKSPRDIVSAGRRWWGHLGYLSSKKAIEIQLIRASFPWERQDRLTMSL